VFSAPSALELYAQVFAEEDALDKFEAFASLNGPAFYGLPPNEDRITLKRAKARVPDDVPVGGGEAIKPFLAGRALDWTVAE
jgi:dihydroorotase